MRTRRLVIKSSSLRHLGGCGAAGPLRVIEKRASADNNILIYIFAGLATIAVALCGTGMFFCVRNRRAWKAADLERSMQIASDAARVRQGPGIIDSDFVGGSNGGDGDYPGPDRGTSGWPEEDYDGSGVSNGKNAGGGTGAAFSRESVFSDSGDRNGRDDREGGSDRENSDDGGNDGGENSYRMRSRGGGASSNARQPSSTGRSRMQSQSGRSRDQTATKSQSSTGRRGNGHISSDDEGDGPRDVDSRTRARREPESQSRGAAKQQTGLSRGASKNGRNASTTSRRRDDSLSGDEDEVESRTGKELRSNTGRGGGGRKRQPR
ncbi:hypothetical protein HDU83_005730 [Entophlyctis luteolus]|nr:hypothetical protein HDU82_005387 [Entophlyctis luteolus]KAJ3343212.1 hypothetical protein HDU83_005730 [Entophlyctis luteolus]